MTVSRAYELLSSDGLLRSGVGSGTYVQDLVADESDKMDRSNYSPFLSKGAEAILRSFREFLHDSSPGARGCVDFASLIPDERFFPVEAFRECLDAVLAREGSRLLQYCGTPGYSPLRESLAQRMQSLGVAVSEEEIVVVNGAQQGIDLVLRCFLSPGDRVALAVPSYHHVFPLLRMLGAEAEAVPMTAAGPDLEGVRAAARDPRVRLLYVMPDFHNPTGVTCPDPQRRALYRIAREQGRPVLEDDFERDLSLDPDLPLPIKALDREGLVVYLGTFSKSLFPGLRIGWLAASGPALKAILAVKKAADLENSGLLQAAVHAFLERGFYDRHLDRIREVIRRRMETAFAALEAHMPEGVTWSRPAGGYVLWIRLPRGISSERVYTLARERGVLLTPGTLFDPRGADPGGVRLSLSRTGEDGIRKGIETLGRAVEAALEEGDRRAGRIPAAPQHL